MTQAPRLQHSSLRSAVIAAPWIEAVISTGAVPLHGTAPWRDPRISSLPLPPVPRPARAVAYLLLCLFPAALFSQTTTNVQPQPAPAAFTDAIARAFTTARTNAHLRPLARIPDRPILRRIVCSAAANNSAVGHNEGNATFISRESQADAALIPVTNLSHLPAAIQRVAEYDDRATARGRRIARFSVAAFTTPVDPSITWVGIALYWSRLTEYAATHLTRTYAPPDLRYDLVPACLAVQ